jgi:hypothetical protein
MVAIIALGTNAYAKIDSIIVKNTPANFIMVGNVNFELENGYDFTTETRQAIVPINHDSLSGVSNSNNAPICLPTFPCPGDGVVGAVLTWSGKVNSTDQAPNKIGDKWKTVKIKIGNGPYETITANDDDCFFNSDVTYSDAIGVYTCHYDLKKYFNDAINNGIDVSNTTITVADLQTSYESYTPNQIATRFGGWTLTIIYEKMGERKADIAYYPLLEFMPGGLSGDPGESMERRIKLARNYTGAGDLIVGIVCGGTTRKDNPPLYIDKTCGFNNGKGENAIDELNNIIHQHSGCEEDGLNLDTILYSKGYDQLVLKLQNPLNNQGKGTYIDKNGEEIYVKIKGGVEQHLLTDVIVMTGLPSNEVEAVQKGKKASSNCIEYSIDVNTGKYIENLNNFNLNIKLPDYTISVSDFTIKGAAINALQGEKSFAFGINATSTPTPHNYNYIQDTINGWFRPELLLRSEFQDCIKKKANNFTNKSNTEQYLKIEYNGLIPESLSDTTILKIEFTACVDSVAYAAQSALTGEQSSVTSQSQVSVTGAVSGERTKSYSNPTSEFQQREKTPCSGLYGFGGGDGGGGGALDGSDGPGDGGLNGEPTRIGMNFDFSCINIPDTIRIDACENECIAFDTIKSVMLREHNFDLDAIAREDSARWMKVKRDSIVDLCQLAIDNGGLPRKALDVLYSDSCNWLDVKKFWERAPKKLKGYDKNALYKYMHDTCRVDDSTYIVDVVFKKIDKIIDNPIEVSHLDYQFYIHTDWETEQCIKVTKSETFDVIYATPYIDKQKQHLCNDIIRVDINMETMQMPTLILDKDTKKYGDTIQYCLGSNIDTFLIKKKKPNYAIELTSHTGSFLQPVNDTFYKYVPDISTGQAKFESFKFVQRNNTGCTSDTFKFYIEVLNVEATQTPDVQKDTATCKGAKGDSISIRITDLNKVAAMRAKDFNVRWLQIRDALDGGDTTLRNDTIEINVPVDTDGVYTYAAQYYYLGCSGNKSTVKVTVNKLAEKVTQDTIQFCQHVKPKADEILPYIHTKENSDTLYWFSSTQTSFEEKDSTKLERLLSETDFDKCGEKQFIVKAKNKFGCFGDTSLITINVLCFDSTRTSFNKKGDSVLYCVGDLVETIDQFIVKDSFPESKGFIWEWFKKEQNAPYNTVTGLSSYTPDTISIESGHPSITTYYVTRIDSNKCASKPAAFKVVVDNAISEMPLINDPRAVDYRNDTFVTLGFCKGVQGYPSNVLPLIPTLANYEIEWSEKSSNDVRCDTLIDKPSDAHKEKYYKIPVNTNLVGKNYYCIRQSTVLGCKGPWKNVEIVVNDSVRALPKVEDIVLCQGDDSVQVKNYVQYNGTEPLLINYFDKNKDIIAETDSAYVLAKEAGKYTEAKGNNLYYVSLTNTQTFCEGAKVPIDVIINKQPELPQMNEDTTVYLCANGDTVSLTQRINASIDVNDIDTKIEWTPNDTVITRGDINATYEVYQRDTVTQCVGKPITITVKVSNTINYKSFGTKELCYGESIAIHDTVKRLLKHNDRVIPKDGIQHKIYLLVGTSRGVEITGDVTSSKSRYESDTTRYLISISDTISGCDVKDTATIIFHGLPNAIVPNQLQACQGVNLTLPTPTESSYNYTWRRSAGDKIEGNPTLLALTADETITLTEEDKATGCKETFDVDVTVYPTPANALTSDTAFCQNNPNKKINVTVQPSNDIYNTAANLKLQWFSANGDSINNPIVTDTVVMNDLTKRIKYTVRQTNTSTSCFKDTSIYVTLKKTPVLNMHDLSAVCEPDIISLPDTVVDYISKNIGSTYFANMAGLQFQYGRIINGSTTALSEADAKQLRYIMDKDSVLYTYTVTDADNVCSATDTVFVTINKKPIVPVIEGGKDTIYFCQDDAPIILHAKNNNESKYQTQIYWGEYTSTVTGDELKITANYGNYMAFTKNEKTGCVSDVDTIHAVISVPIEFSAIGTQDLCFRDSIDLIQMVQDQVDKNTKNSVRDIRFSIFRLNGVTPASQAISQKIASTKSKNETDTTRYLIQIRDYVSGCEFQDTATIVFHGLPVIDPIDPITVCQFQDTALPTPNRGYQYEWFRATDGRLINDPTRFNSEQSESIYLKASETFPAVGLACYDSLMVSMDVREIPVAATVLSDTFCQFSGTHLIPVTRNETAANPMADLSIQWFDEKGDSIANPINTDTTIVNAKSRTIKYTIRQFNKVTGCYKDTTVPFVVNKALRLEMEDLAAVCQPEVIDFKGKVMDYLTASTTTNLSNIGNCDITYGKIINGAQTAISDAEASQIEYTKDLDSVLYTYTVVDGVCSASDSVYVTINKKPSKPIIENGKDTIYFCQDDAPIILHAENDNEAKYPTKIHWGEYTSEVTGNELEISANYGDYMAFVKNEETECTSDIDSIHAVISFPIDFKPIGTRDLCFRDSIDLIQMVQEQVDKNTKNSVRDIRFDIFKMNGVTPASQAISQKIASTKAKNETDTTRYLIQIKDHVSGCGFTDTATIVFHGLPVIDPIDPITVCQYQDTALPTPNRGYLYEWFRATDGMLINDPTRFNSEKSESIYLKATETFPAVGLTCYDSLMVSMDVREIPVAATVLSDTFCQLSGTHLIPVTRNETATNPLAELAIQWFDEKGDSIANPINTDTTSVAGKSRTIKYTIRQYNKITGCYKDTVVPFVVNKAIKLDMEDLPAVCQPEVIDFKGKVTDYLTASTTTNITNIGSCDITYGKIINGTSSAITDAEASQIEYTNNIDSMLYTYTVVDGVCSATDSVYVTINQKPSTPIIENGLDTIYFCQSNGQLHLTASHSNDKQTTSIFWGDHKSTLYGDTIEIPSTPPTSQYIAFSKNVLTGCFSEDDTIIVIVKEAIKVTPLGNDGTMELCAGEEVNLYEQAMASFTINQTPHTTLVFNATENGYVVGENELSKVTRSKQDTSYYQFTIEDDQSKCTAENSLKLIFHQLPTFTIEGADVLCEGNDVKLKAVGDERPVSYAWKIKGDEKTLNTTASFTYKEIMQDTTFILIEKLNGTTCADTVSKKITVNVNPAKFGDTTIFICQDTSATSTEEISLGRSSSDISAYSIQWFNTDSTLFSNDETIQVEKTKATAFKYQIETTNRNTGCISPRSNVTINVNPQITIGLDNPDTICQPFTYDLMTNLAKSISGGTQPTYVRTELNGTTISNETAISESGMYTVFYTDENKCDASKTISIQFHQQPGVPQLIGDTILCQGIGDVKLTAKKTGGNSVNQSFVWKTAGAETTADTLTLSTTQYGKTRYNLFAIDLKTRCLSEPDTFDFDVRESIGFRPIGLMEACYATTVDLQEKAGAAYYGSPEEKAISYYKVNDSGSLSTISDPAHVGASGKYVTKATEAISRCERFDTTEVIVYDSLAVSTEGSTLICQGDEVTGLTANNADTYTWIRENGDNAGGASFPYAKDVAQTETFRLIGEKKIGTLYCQDSIEVTIKVNENPLTLSDTAFRFCQDTAGADQPLTINMNARSGETLGLVWTNESGDTLFNVNEEARTSILERGETRYNVSQVNMQTQCSSKEAKIDVTVLPQIRIQLKDTTVCEPNTVNLVQFTGKAAKAEEYTNSISAVAYELLQNGSAVDKTNQADSVSEGGQYRVTYQYEGDGLTCQSEGTLQLFFNKQPIRPNIADQNFCQNTGSYELAGNVNSAGVRLVWEDLSIFPSRIDTNRTSITTDVATQKLFLIRQVQDVSGCVSEADSAMITIYPAIHAIDKDTAICYGEAVDLNQFSRSSYQGGTPKYIVSFKNIDGQAFNEENVNKSNTYFAYFSDSMNVCHDTATLIVDVNQPIVLKITGGGDACTDKAVTLVAEGAEQYEWSNGEKTPSITLSSNEAETRTLQVEGRSKFHDIYCFADTSVSVTFHNAVKPRELTFDTCARNIVTIDDVILKNNVTEHIDTLWNITDDIRYSNLSQNIGKSGQYEIAVHNDEGCTAHHTLTINMHQVDNLKVEKQESTYCYGSLANFTAKGENAREFEWNNLTDGTIKTGITYNEPIYEKSDFMLIATEKELGCKDTFEFTVDAYPYKDLTVTGNVTSCRDSLVILSVEDALTNIQWHMGDTLLTDRNIRFIADVDRRIQVTGIDENGCQATKSITVSVAYLEDPVIAYSTINDTEYALSDDVKEVEFKETTTPDGSDLYKFIWNFGDGRTWIDSTSNEVSHVYNDTLIHSRRDIPVSLTVEHQYGCRKSTSTILKIDPFIFVPNTMIADGSYIFMENYDVQIYDRVGTLIYDGNGWDGTYKGEPASEDTYFYSLTYFDKGEKKIRTGYITVVR